jgi:glycerol-3-phosphate dehydrogenase
VGAMGTVGVGAGPAVSLGEAEGAHSYGNEQTWLAQLPGANHWLTPSLSEAMVRFAARYEYALSVEDVLARRSRLLFLDARLAAQAAPAVGDILQSETGLDPDVQGFVKLAAQYRLD